MKPTSRPRSTVKPGRPAGFVRERAIDAAMHLFWKHGFPSVSTSDLAGAMSIQRSSFYNSFGSPAAVFREALTRYGAQAPDAVLGRVRSGQPVVPVVVGMFREICRVRASDQEGRGCMVCNGVAELVGVDRTLGRLLARAVTDRTALVERLLRQAARQREIPESSNCAALAGAMVTFMTGLNTISKVVRDEARLWAICQQFLAGLGISPDVIKVVGGSCPISRR